MIPFKPILARPMTIGVFIFGSVLSWFCVSLTGTAADIKASANLSRGEIIRRADVVLIVDEAGHSNGNELASVVGQQVKRTIRAGQKITPNLIGPPILVKRNERVSMIYRRGALHITAFGRALDAGGAGDVITVMNLDSRKKVSGVVNKKGEIEVNP